MTPEGLTICSSSYGPKKTMDRLVAAATDRGMTILARIDHASAAAEAGLELRPTEVLIFGNPRAGTPLMQVAQTAGIDLPLKALVWADEEGGPGSATTTRAGSRDVTGSTPGRTGFLLP